ncbi:hypothetical protein AB0D49_32220 [Streptomyces sp. NPDC048290]|uniref:hypothetical protein n=1 Tax=Streptomyces sp. NPDC048290 TaxID=3155811 RepID=UPI00344A9CA2
MQNVTQVAWESAALRLLEDVYAYAATGPRTQPDWQSDVLALLNRETEDPRGWRVLDQDTDERRTSGRTSFPFRPLSRDTVAEHLWEITPESAARLLEIMACDWAWAPLPSEEEAAQRRADAHLLLDRYGDKASFHTNVSAARRSPSLDLTTHRVPGWWPFSEYTGDFGVVVVSPEEVGLFWAFDPS